MVSKTADLFKNPYFETNLSYYGHSHQQGNKPSEIETSVVDALMAVRIIPVSNKNPHTSFIIDSRNNNLSRVHSK